MIHQNKIDYWESKSLALLRKATIKHGIKASCTDKTNYGSVFTRDAAMSGIAGLLYDDEVLMNGLRATVDMLYQTKGRQGQIASNYKIEDDRVAHISFGTLSPKIDSITWYLISIGLLMERGFKYDLEYVEKTIELLDALEYNGKDLIYIPQGGNWADEYPFEGYILYDQILRCWALKLLGKNFNNAHWISKSEFIFDKIKTKYFNEETGHYNCSFTPALDNQTFDFAAHALLGMIESVDDNEELNKSLEWINSFFLSKGNLPCAFYPIINENDPNWNRISGFHLFDFKNKPHHYHNGGIWLIWLGWYALALKRNNKDIALKELASLVFDLLEKSEGFNFDEYFSSDTKMPNGTTELCYSATGILFLCHSLKPNTNQKDII